MKPPTDRNPPRRAEAGTDAPRRWTWPLLILGGATFLGLLQAVQTYYYMINVDRRMPFLEILRYWLPDYWLWAALTPAILWIVRRFPLRGEGWKGRLAVHLSMAPLFVAAEILLGGVVIGAIGDLPGGYTGLWDYFTSVLSQHAVWGFLFYGMIMAAAHAYDLHREVQRRDRQTAQLETRLARAQLRALKMQLQPHFLFNTLHSVGMLVRVDRSDDALGMLAGLSDLLRQSLDRADQQEVSLREEFEFLERYLEVEQIRFHDRLAVDYDVDPRTLGARVPNLILQPLVENAVRHGVEPHAGPRHVTVRSWLEAGELLLEVTDDGLPPDHELPPSRRTGVGLRNVRERLRKLYGAEARLEIRSRREGGVSARITLPFRRRPDGPPEPTGAPESTGASTGSGPDGSRAAARRA